MDNPGNIEMEKKPKKMLGILAVILAALVLVLFLSIYPKGLDSFKKYFLGAINSTVTVSVSNYVPTITSQYLNTGGAITLTEGGTKTVHVTATITDYNGCEDLDHATVAVYKIGTTCASAVNGDNDNCYFATVPITCSASNSYSLDKTFDIYYYADNSADWQATIIPSDKTPADGIPYDTASVAINPLQALSVTALDYGTLSPGAKSTGDTHTTSVTNTGNTTIDFYLSGTDLTGGLGTIGSIPVANQKYGLASFEFDTGGTALTSDVPGNAAGANIAKATQPPGAGTPVYWQISVPNGVKGALSGTTTFTVKAP